MSNAAELVVNIMHVGDVHLALWLHTEQDPSQAEWEEASARIEHLIETVPGLRLRGLVVSDGGAPNLKQRGQISATMRRAQGKFSIVTTAFANPIKRGIITAVRLLMPGVAFYRPEDFRRALAHVDVAAAACDAVMAEYVRMQAKLRPSKTLELIAAGTR